MKKIARNTLAKMIIVDELSFRHVEKEGFKFFVKVLEPRFTIPCRTTIARDCMNLYYEEKKKLKKAFQKQQVCLTLTLGHQFKILTICVLLLIGLIMIGTCIKES